MPNQPHRRPRLNFDTIVAELKREQDRIGRAINALLEGAGLTRTVQAVCSQIGSVKTRRRHYSCRQEAVGGRDESSLGGAKSEIGNFGQSSLCG